MLNKEQIADAARLLKTVLAMRATKEAILNTPHFQVGSFVLDAMVEVPEADIEAVRGVALGAISSQIATYEESLKALGVTAD